MYTHKGEKINITTQREYINVLTQRGNSDTPTQVETKICLHQGRCTVTT